MFNPNSSFLYTITAIVILVIVGQSVFFLLRAWKRAKVIGISAATLRKTVISSAIYTVAPAVSILIGVIALSKSLGLPLPWLRLSVIGAITYETAAAASATSALGLSLGSLITDASAYLTVVWVMTIGIMMSLILVVLLTKRIERGITKIRTKDQKWSEILTTSLFLGMISAFLGMVFSGVSEGLSGWIPVFVMLAAMLIMALCGLLMKLLKWKWLSDYALPISMLGSMALSIPITNLVNTLV
ncbi:MAG TPA: DUF5058 family protein [Candidatus Limiplasma sp.]|nr:DUF5058 family protein [Candidatus Limiplasma sp.]